MSESRDILKEEFQDEEYRHAYAEDFLNTSIATQIRVLREQHGLTQEDLAKRIGTKQAGISRLENVNHSVWKTDTLHKIARALDVRLRITFETFGTLIDEAEGFSRKTLERYSFNTDPAFQENVASSAQAQTTTSVNNEDLFTGSFQENTSIRTVVNIDVGQIVKTIKSGINLTGSAVTLSRDEIPLQPATIHNNTSKGEIIYGGDRRAA